jgi:thiamine pyrophosphate-dependent acetolactate synthase large subunit-like protein
LKPTPAFAATDDDIASIAEHIDTADTVVILCGTGCRGSIELLRELSDRIKAPLIHTVKGKDLLPYDDPHWIGGIGMIGTKPAYEAAMHCDLLLMMGTDYPYSNFLPQKGKVIQVDERPQVLGRRAPTVLGVVGSARPTLERLVPKVARKTDSRFLDKVTRERAKWDQRLNEQADLTRSSDQIHPQAVARMIGDLARPDAVFVLDTGLNTLWSGNWIRQRGSQRIIGSFNNAAVGTALGQANGVQALDRTRQVIALCGDGGFNMLMCEFLTAVHHKLPVKVVVFNNSAFGLITLEAESAGLPAFQKGIEFPNPDYAALARACGAQGFTARRPGELSTAISKAFAASGPAIVDAVVAADEVPNVPHLDLATMEHVAIAKIKEAVLAVTGA